MPNANLTATTRELWERTRVTEVYYAMPLYAALLDQQKKSWINGTKLKRTVIKDTLESLAQSYDINEALTSGKKTIYDTLEFDWKRWQLPVSYTDEDAENTGGGDAAPVDLVAGLIEASRHGARIKLNQMAYATPAAGAAKKDFLGLADALDHSQSYGGKTRSASTNTWLQSVSLDGTYTDQDDNITASIANFRKIRSACQQYAPGAKPADFVAICGSDLFQAFQSQIEARHLYVRTGETPLAGYGFNTINIDGVELVEDPSLNLDLNNGTSGNGDYTPEWLFMLHKPDWELRLHPDRALVLTDFVWQGEQTGGKDESLARVMAKGNLVCWRPRASCWRSYATA
ncbi:hypothetical protein LCGC14_0095220 [marine sediment metagenome]|uniref:Phage major capsid protein n=1 Tax=marine sediment metagenome TaxID=412755 RepID=A0A0F9VHP2_9ZZZZ|nr:phage major capsid protein [Phycisphaerae bacterium]HDZ45146.1 phage major capsid protein [Phycisphaerae bacterium]